MKEETINKLERMWEIIPSPVKAIAFNFTLGATLGAIGKNCMKEPLLLPALPLGMDLYSGGIVNLGTPFYIAGVAVNYIPEIINYFSN